MSSEKQAKQVKRGNTLLRSVFSSREVTIFFILLAMMAISAIVSPSFRSLGNIGNIFNQNAMYGLMAIGMSFVLIGGGMDLSIGSTSALAGMVAALMMRDHGNVLLGAVLALVIGIVVGAVNGLIIIYLKLPPLYCDAWHDVYCQKCLPDPDGGTSCFRFSELGEHYRHWEMARLPDCCHDLGHSGSDLELGAETN